MLNDPNESAENQRRLVLTFMFSLLIFLAFQTFFPPTSIEPIDETAEENLEIVESTENNSENDDFIPVDEPNILPPQRLVSENSVLFFTNSGARLLNVEVLSPEQYIPHENMRGVFPNGLDVENQFLDYFVKIDGLPDLHESSRFEFLEDESAGSEQEGYSRLVYQWTSPDGFIIVTKTFENEDNPFGASMSVAVENTGERPRRFDGINVQMFGDRSEGGGSFLSMKSIVEGICVVDHEAEHRPARKLDQQRSFVGETSFGAVEERYFMVAAAPRTIGNDPTFGDQCSYGPAGEDHFVTAVGQDEFTINAGESLTFNYTFYVGPKDERYLKEYDHDFQRSINFGFFTFLSRPIRVALLFFQTWFINWGLAIIALTVFIKLLTFPLTQKSFANMEKMRTIQPQLKEIQEEFADDKVKLAEEQMKLFRESGTSPLGGCLPMLLQMPIYFALYRTIWGSAELYNAPFYFWITDLSQPDPYKILPIAMGIVMFLQQKLMPQAANANPQMKMIQTGMPIMFTVMMLMMPSGLVLYIFINMLLSVMQQLYIRRSNAVTAPLKA